MLTNHRPEEHNKYTEKFNKVVQQQTEVEGRISEFKGKADFIQEKNEDYSGY